MTTDHETAPVWLITGCSAGFGRALVDAALARGDRVVATARRAMERSGSAETEDEQSKTEALTASYEGTGLLGRSPAMIDLYKEIARVAPFRSTVLVLGESGTGKELVARAIHKHSPRAAKPFVAINCGALTETLLEAELFGHVRGSFMGAVGDRKGLWEEAEEGTLAVPAGADEAEADRLLGLARVEAGQGEAGGGGGRKEVAAVHGEHPEMGRAVETG